MMWILWLVVVTAILRCRCRPAGARAAVTACAEEAPDDVVVRLPEDRSMVASDVEALRLPLAVRGYQMAAVDEVLDRLAVELALRDAQIRAAAERPGPDDSEAGERHIAVDVVVDAPPQVVWDAVTDWPRQSEWMLGTTVRATELRWRGRRGRHRGVHRGRQRAASWTPWSSPSGTRRGGASSATPARWSRGSGSSRCWRCRGAGRGSSGPRSSTCPWGGSAGSGWPVVRPVFAWGVRRSLQKLAADVERARGS